MTSTLSGLIRSVYSDGAHDIGGASQIITSDA